MGTKIRSRQPGKSLRTATVLACVMGLMLVGTAAFGTVSASHGDEPSSHFVVELDEGGSATVSLVVTFGLTNEERRDAFQSLESDESARTEFRGRFVDRMRSVAETASDESGREMTVSNPSIDLSRTDDGETGLATLTVRWSNLAAQEDGRLFVTEPFDSGFTPAYDLVVVTPDGYRIVEASPAPDARKDTLVTWNAGTSIDEFRVVVEDGSAQRDESRTSGQPGFGLVGGLFALLAAIWAVRWRSS